MFKNKKIVALVLCALMLFVPVAAAADIVKVDFLKKYSEESKETLADAADNAELAYAGALKAMLDLKESDSLDKAILAKATADSALKDYEKELKAAKEKIAEVENLKREVETTKIGDKAGYKAFVGGTFANQDENTALTAWTNANKSLIKSKAALEATVAKHDASLELAKVVEAVYPRILAAIKAGDTKTAAEDIFKLYTKDYKDKSDEVKAALAPFIVKAWENYAKQLNEFEKRSAYYALDDAVKKVLDKADTKYEVMSTGEKGWILSDEAKNGCLKDVAEFKVEKKDGKFVAKVYGKDGKEMKIGQQLTVYRPIGKDVKVLKAKVDGKDVTFSVGLRNGQNYVSVPVIY